LFYNEFFFTVAQNGSAEAESVGRGRAHGVNYSMLHLLQNDINGFALLFLRVQLIVIDYDFILNQRTGYSDILALFVREIFKIPTFSA
jgi:hypothetical protein